MSSDRTWPITALGCLVFEHDCIEFDFEDHRVTVLSGPRTHRRGHICRHSGVRIRDSTYSAVPAVTSEQNRTCSLAGYPVHFAESSCSDVHCRPLVLGKTSRRQDFRSTARCVKQLIPRSSRSRRQRNVRLRDSCTRSTLGGTSGIGSVLNLV